MLKLVFKNDGSIKYVQLPQYVTQGTSGVESVKLAVAFEDKSDNFSAIGYFKLPSGDTVSLALLDTDEFELFGETYPCKCVNLDDSVTLYEGIVLCSIRATKDVGSTQLYTYNFRLTVNPTTYEPDDTDSHISNAQYQNLADEVDELLQNSLTDENTYRKSEVDELLGNKVDKKTTNGLYAYTHNGSTQGEVRLDEESSLMEKGYIVQRELYGFIRVPNNPQANTHAANKKYVDDTIATAISQSRVKFTITHPSLKWDGTFDLSLFCDGKLYGVFDQVGTHTGVAMTDIINLITSHMGTLYAQYESNDSYRLLNPVKISKGIPTVIEFNEEDMVTLPAGSGYTVVIEYL